MRGKTPDGNYELTRLLGKGAFAKVYLVEDRQGGRFACKVSENLKLLQREAEFHSRTEHPLFPRFVSHGQDAERGFLVMEYIPGETLEEALKRGDRFSSGQTAEIGVRLAEGLKALHERREPLLFRDIKPANIILGEHGSVRLLDFGCVCKEGVQGAMAGTPGFGAPEQFIQGSFQDVRADVYGLGRTLQAMAGENCDRKLKSVLDRCTGQQAEERLWDMRWVSELLEVCGREHGRFDAVQKAVLRGKIRCEKNIWR